MKFAIILKYLPQIIELVLSVVDMIKEEKDEFIIRKKLKGITSAFKEKEVIKKAKLLNDVFRY